MEMVYGKQHASTPKEAVENLLCVSAALLQDANFNKGLPGFVGKAKCIRGGIFQVHPKK
jgi:hypothetical protein